jgi:predicted CXXCH cytochrome family protein
MPFRLPSLALAAAVAVGAPAAAVSAPPEGPAAPRQASPLAPLPASTPRLVVHAPYESGSCTPCHATDDARDPGKVAGSLNDVCVGCHTELERSLAAKHVHAAVEDACTNCHNPHSSTVPRLLLSEAPALCAECHADTVEAASSAPVQHRALATGAKCMNCHNPHGSSFEKLLFRMPAEMCLGCHDRDGMKSADGRPLTNMKAWLAKNENHHGPVEAGDCSSCHTSHGGENFRLLTERFPPTFYAAFDKKNYALCMSCHNEAVYTAAETTSLTSFRDGSRNLHFAHVNVGERGRTCRACHDVHASGQGHHIREGVPFGTTGWVLKLNYVATADGGSCSKTCHETRTYRRGPRVDAKALAK